MSFTVSFNGQTFTLPSVGDSGWGDAINSYFTAISTGTMQKTTTSFPLLTEMSFGTEYGLKTLYIKTQTANPASTGVIRLANTDTVSWRNGANDGNLALSVVGDELYFNGNPVTPDTSSFLSSAGGTYSMASPLVLTSNGVSAPSFTSSTFNSGSANPASAGALRLAYTDTIQWRNAANYANQTLSVLGTNIYWNGSQLNDQGGGGGGNVTVPLTDGDCDFGNSYGIKVKYVESQSATLPASGVLRLGVDDTIAWKNGLITNSIKSIADDYSPYWNRNDGITTTDYQFILNTLPFDWLMTNAANPAQSGVLRLGQLDTIAWRNAADTGDLGLYVDGDDKLYFGAQEILTTGSTGVVSTIFYNVGTPINSDSSIMKEITPLSLTMGGTVGNPTVVKFEAYIRYQCSTTSSGIRIGFEAPEGSQCNVEIVVNSNTTGSPTLGYFPVNGTGRAGAAIDGDNVEVDSKEQLAILRGTVYLGGTAGNFVFQFKSTDNTTNHATILPISNVTYTVLQVF